MGEAIVTAISSIIINLVSNDVDIEKRNFIERIKYKRFIKKSRKWLDDFCIKNEGTILLTGVFVDYIKYHDPITKIHNFVCRFEDRDKSDKIFIQELVQHCISVIRSSGKQCSVIDEQKVGELFFGIYDRLREYLERNLTQEQKYVIFNQIKLNAELKALVAAQRAEQKEGFDKVLGYLERVDVTMNEEVALEIYHALNMNLLKGNIEDVYKILPLLDGKNADLELGIKCGLKIVSNYTLPEIDVWNSVAKIENVEIRNDIIRKLILYNLDKQDNLKLISGQAKSNQLNNIIDNIIVGHNDEFFSVNNSEENHLSIYEFELKNIFADELWLVKRIGFLHLCNQPIHIKEEMLRSLLGDDIYYTEDIFLLERKLTELAYENPTDEPIAILFEQLKANKKFYEHACEAIQRRYYVLWLKTATIIKSNEANNIINDLPEFLKNDEEVKTLTFRVQINNDNVSENDVIKFCVGNGKYNELLYFFFHKGMDYHYIRDFFERHAFLLSEDIQVFSIYLTAVEIVDGNEVAKRVLVEYESQYKDFVEYWISRIKILQDKDVAKTAVEKWFKNELKSSSYKPDDELVNVLMQLGCYDEAGELIKKIETAGHISPMMLRMKSRVLIVKEKYIDALNVLKSIFSQYKEDPYVVDNIIVLSLENKRKISQDVLDAAISIGTARLLMLVACVYRRIDKSAEAQITITKALLRAKEEDYDVYNTYFCGGMRDANSSIKITCVDADTSVFLKNKDTGAEKIYCIYNDDVLPKEPYYWEGAEHIYMDTAIQLGLVRQKKDTEIVIDGEEYIITEIMPVEAFLVRTSIQRLVDGGRAKQFSVETNDDGISNQDQFFEWIKANTPKEERTVEWLENYKDMGEIALPFCAMNRFTKLTLAQFILVLIEDKSIIIRELLLPDDNRYEKYIISFSGLITLYKLGLPTDYLLKKDIVVAESLATEIKEEAAKIIEENNREHVSSIGIHDDRVFMQVSTDDEKKRWMSEAVNIKKYSEAFLTQPNQRDIKFEQLEDLHLNDFLGIFDYDALVIAKEQERNLVSAEEFISQMTRLKEVGICSMGILDFLCTLDLDVIDLIKYMRRMIDYRYLISINKRAVEIIRDAFMSADEKRTELIAEKWDEFLSSIGETEEEYKEKSVQIINAVIRQMNIEQIVPEDFILRQLGYYAIKYNNIKIEVSVNENFEIEVRAYQEEVGPENGIIEKGTLIECS